MPDKCIPECPAWQRQCGCGYLAAGTSCRHPRWRAEWEKARASQAAQEREQERKPARARQLRMEVG
jgi:hypothetical protein